MLDNPTLEKMRALRLTGMAEAFSQQLEDPAAAELSFQERLGLLIDRQWAWKEDRALQRRLKNARLRQQAALEDLDYRRPRGLDRSLMAALASCSWVRRRRNVLVIGPCGVGKTFICCALAHQALRRGHSALYARAGRLFGELALARAEGSLHKRLAQLARIDVLVVDDWVMAPMGEAQRRDFLDIAEDRYQARSTILASQIPVEHWHERIGDPTLADGILDRLVHNSHRIALKGASMRKLKAQESEEPEDP